MGIQSAQTIAPQTVVRTDVCVIGSGAAGITLARRLDGSNTDVVMLEAGGHRRDHDAETESFTVRRVNGDTADPTAERGRLLGGSTRLWFGRMAMPDPIDFEQRSWVPSSGWPISLDELDPWMTHAGEVLRAPTLDGFDLTRWSNNATREAFERSGSSELRPFFWPEAPDMAKEARTQLEASRNVRTLTDSTVQEIVVDESDRVAAVRVVGPGGRSFTVEATHFVLAAGGFENARLLLASNARHREGVGNQFDNVGRYFLDHPRGEGLASIDLRPLSARQREVFSHFDEKVDSPFGPTQLRLVFSESLQRSEELLNHSLHGYLVSDVHASDGFDSYRRLRDRVSQRDLTKSSELLRDVASVGRIAPGLAQLAMGRAPATSFVVIDQMEQEPDRSSRVTVDHHDLDRFGLPRVSLDWQIGESTRRSHRRMHELFRDLLAEQGITNFASEVLDPTTGDPRLVEMKHPSGTTRMSASPRDGVVDTDCRVHGIDNLYVAGSSVFPTNGHFNPTVLIIALAARLADHLSAQQRPTQLAAADIAEA